MQNDRSFGSEGEGGRDDVQGGGLQMSKITLQLHPSRAQKTFKYNVSGQYFTILFFSSTYSALVVSAT